jgi:hypothetical protein
MHTHKNTDTREHTYTRTNTQAHTCTHAQTLTHTHAYACTRCARNGLRQFFSVASDAPTLVSLCLNLISCPDLDSCSNQDM